MNNLGWGLGQGSVCVLKRKVCFCEFGEKTLESLMTEEPMILSNELLKIRAAW